MFRLFALHCSATLLLDRQSITSKRGYVHRRSMPPSSSPASACVIHLFDLRCILQIVSLVGALRRGSRVDRSLNECYGLLALNFQKIGATGALRLADALSRNSSVTEVNLLDNVIGDVGASCLAAALRHQPYIRALYLFDNQIGDDGASALANALTHNSTLTTLDLMCNRISDTGAESFIRALTLNSTLTEINLGGNLLSESATESVASLCAVCSMCCLYDLFVFSLT